MQPKWKSSIESAKTRLGADCGSDHELLIAKFRLKLKKVGKTTRSSRYDLNQIPYDYTVEVRNKFKGLDLIDRVPDELWNAVRGVAKSQTQLSDFAFTFHFHALEKEMASHSSVLAWRIPGTGNLHRVGHD